MKKNTLYILLLAVSSFVNGQTENVFLQSDNAQSTPPFPPDGGGGGVTPGSPSVTIDTYLPYLIMIAFALIIVMVIKKNKYNLK